jgi:hypothetical protein
MVFTDWRSRGRHGVPARLFEKRTQKTFAAFEQAEIRAASNEPAIRRLFAAFSS